MVLRKGHRAGVKPAVDDLGNPFHGLPAVRAGTGNRVNIGAVQLNGFSVLISGELGKLLPAPDRDLLFAVLTFPDI